MANANSLNIAAAVAAGGTDGFELCWFAAVDTVGPVAVAYTAEVQTMTITGTPTGGTFNLFWKGLGVPLNAYNVPTATLQTAVNTAWASYLNGGSVAVTGTAGTNYIFTFPSILGNVTPVTVTAAFTGGSSPAAAVVETTPGAGGSLASVPVPAAFKSAGFCSSDGLGITPNESVNTITPYGSSLPVRTIIVSSTRDFDVTFWETNQVTKAVYNRLPLGSVVAGADGSMAVSVGAQVNTIYAGIFDTVVDGNNRIRRYAARLQVSKIGAVQFKPGGVVGYPVTFTPTLDANGIGIYEYDQIGALAGTGVGL